MDTYAKQAAFVLLHHLKKRETDSCGDALLGATVLSGRTDVKIYLKQVSDDDTRRIIHSTKRRGGMAIEKTYLDFNHHTGRSTLGMTLADERKQNAGKTADRIRNDIIEYVHHHPGTTEDECLHIGIDGNGDAKRREFKSLRRIGTLRKSGTGTKGSPFVYCLSDSIPTEVRGERKAA
jgi:hypothetical protein